MIEGLIGKKELKQLVPVSATTIARWEAEGKFPKRLRLGDYPASRAVWRRRDVLEWIERLDPRPDKPGIDNSF